MKLNDNKYFNASTVVEIETILQNPLQMQLASYLSPVPSKHAKQYYSFSQLTVKVHRER